MKQLEEKVHDLFIEPLFMVPLCEDRALNPLLTRDIFIFTMVANVVVGDIRCFVSTLYILSTTVLLITTSNLHCLFHWQIRKTCLVYRWQNLQTTLYGRPGFCWCHRCHPWGFSHCGLGYNVILGTYLFEKISRN